MSGDWIKVECTLSDKPEVWQIAGMLGIDPDAVVGKLIRVWAWFDSHTVDGNANGVTYPLVDRIAGVAGFAEAMCMAGWLSQNGSVMSLPNFDRHNGKTAKNRALTNKRVALHREEQRKGNDHVTPTVTPEALPKPLPEKRREEKKEKKENARVARSPSVTFTEYENALPDGEPFIAPDDKAFAWAESVNLPDGYLSIAYLAFSRRYGEGGQSEGKKYSDWRRVFRNAIAEDWMKVWRVLPGGGYALTTMGEQLRLQQEAGA